MHAAAENEEWEIKGEWGGGGLPPRPAEDTRAGCRRPLRRAPSLLVPLHVKPRCFLFATHLFLSWQGAVEGRGNGWGHRLHVLYTLSFLLQLLIGLVDATFLPRKMPAGRAVCSLSHFFFNKEQVHERLLIRRRRREWQYVAPLIACTVKGHIGLCHVAVQNTLFACLFESISLQNWCASQLGAAWDGYIGPHTLLLHFHRRGANTTASLLFASAFNSASRLLNALLALCLSPPSSSLVVPSLFALLHVFI
jgi:hypothetical protein